MTRLVKALVIAYQRFFSARRPYRVCRFEPTCSEYMLQAIDRYHSRGILMGLARILRCQPFARGGYDPLPDHFTLKRNQPK
ncbi:membrane protein insertion efficiency factor YidD [Limosilactobacillus fermentum]|uniref:Putative membrane protein insertion efficiency factor n=5 Tax=Limosilactobacillus fermentum TaxID=1613 RepID=YIDD_LIMF3|nr:membrane protein insertion efficiency factor YidD [Limosilactobacillus fermentum]B2GAV0.1 RecName: Full=Putative membrane protein insertion efficiency factor [Limosilactobacillus fermentum IFO 3956]EQC58850.1 membrane protein [Limosilactobacillus fermentum MTCC 8711]MCR5280559.1 membrane protein insertion efficiency factor YidD [Lactobacillus sp.]APU45437.1 membrane protein insertion efficiency factor YidD [Limosilactobacillus fermentum]ARB00279.1 membrane protein insertion efficiency facto